MNENTVLFFLHVPKAAGTTLHAILEKHYSVQETFTIDGLHVRESIEKFTQMPPDEQRRIKLVRGHMPFGLHEYTSSPATYITFLRDPVDRVISYYYYVLRSPSHYLHLKVVGSNMSLLNFVESRLTTELYDFQVKLLAGAKSELHSWNYDDSLLELALDNLDRYFSVAGLSEFFDESLLLMKHSLGWRFWPFYRKRNVTRGRAKIDTIDENTIQLIKKANALDCVLYDRARKKLQAGLDTANITKGRVFYFRLMNRMYNISMVGKT